MQQSVYEGLLTQGGSAPLPGELGNTRIMGFQPIQALASLLTIGTGWHFYNSDYEYGMIAGGIGVILGLGGLVDSAY